MNFNQLSKKKRGKSVFTSQSKRVVLEPSQLVTISSTMNDKFIYLLYLHAQINFTWNLYILKTGPEIKPKLTSSRTETFNIFVIRTEIRSLIKN